MIARFLRDTGSYTYYEALGGLKKSKIKIEGDMIFVEYWYGGVKEEYKIIVDEEIKWIRTYR